MFTKRTKVLLGVLLATGCSVAYAASYNRVPSSTFANASTTCGATIGNQCFITDCLTELCTAGGGAIASLSQYNGTAWTVVANAVAGGPGALTGTTADTFTLDSDGDALVLNPQVGGLTLDRVAAGTVTLTALDDDATAALTIDPGGAAQLTLGSADVTAIVHISDADTQLQNGATGNVDLTFHDYADTTDDDQAHTLLRTNCTDASTGAEDCDFSIGVVEAGAAPETRLAFDADGDITIGSANNAGVILNALNAQQRNNATGTVTLAFADYADTTDDDQDHGRVQVNCTDTGSGSEDCDMSLSAVEAGAAPEQRILIDADAGVTLGSSNNNLLTVTTDGTGDSEVVLPDSSVGRDEVGGNMLVQGIFCGDLPNNTTNYTSPITGYPSGPFYAATTTGNDLSYALAGDGCAAQDDTTEANADEIMFTQTATKVIGLYCRVSGSGANGVTLAVRSAAAALTPAVTCTIATGSTECTSYTPTTTDVAANATLAVSAVSTEDLSAQDYWCMVQFALQ